MRFVLGLIIGLVGAVTAAAPIAAQELVAEVRTWNGDTLRLNQPSLEVLYTILVKRGDEGPQSPDAGQQQQAPAMLFGTTTSLSGMLDKKPDPMSGLRQAETVTLQKGAVERRIPLLNLASLAFARQQIASELPPYYFATHFRYAATAVLADGTTIEADYVNLGTTILRGITSDGRVEIPWYEIETLRFVR